LKKQPGVRVKVSIREKLKPFEPERIYRIRTFAPVVVEDVFIDPTKLSPKRQIAAAVMPSDRNAFERVEEISAD